MTLFCLFSEKTIEIDFIQPGDVVKVVPGARIPVDGMVTCGSAAVDESMITGEALHVTRTVGDCVIGGTLNVNGILQVRADKVGGDTVLSQIVQLVEDAQTSKVCEQAMGHFIQYIIGQLCVCLPPSLCACAHAHACVILVCLSICPSVCVSVNHIFRTNY